MDGSKRAELVKARYGSDYYRKIGRKGGKAKTAYTVERGFASSGNARAASAKGLASRYKNKARKDLTNE